MNEFVCVCVCVWERERERKREQEPFVFSRVRDVKIDQDKVNSVTRLDLVTFLFFLVSFLRYFLSQISLRQPTSVFNQNVIESIFWFCFYISITFRLSSFHFMHLIFISLPFYLFLTSSTCLSLGASISVSVSVSLFLSLFLLSHSLFLF